MGVTTGKVYTVRKGNTNEITIAPDLSNLDLIDTYDRLVNDTTIRQILPSDTISDGEIQAAIDYRNTFKQGDVITALCNFYSNANSSYFKQADFSLENILYWYQKLKYSNKEITSYRSQVDHYGQNILTNQIPGAALFAQNTFNSGSFNENSYFDNISDSIGIIANSKYIQLDSTLPVFDVGQQYYGVPIPYSASIENKMSATARNVAYNLSQKTTTLMRRNLLGIGYTNLTLQQNMNADASTSHGLNLINDLPTFCTINSSLSQLKDKLTSVYKEAKLFGFIQYLSNIGNETAMNLRDIFPISPSDKDFVVITSEENAQASQAIAQQEASDAQAEKALYAQQQVIGGVASSNINGTLQNVPSSTLQSSTGTVPKGSVAPGSGSSQFVNGKLIGSDGMGVPDTNQLGQAVTLDGTLKCDTDGSKPGVFNDPTGQRQTSLNINGSPADAATVPYIVVSPENQKAYGIKKGDWGCVTDKSSGNQVWGRVADVGPNQAPGEVSAAAVQALGYGVTQKGNIASNKSLGVSVSYYPSSRNVAGNPSSSTKYVASNTTVPKPGGA